MALDILKILLLQMMGESRIHKFKQTNKQKSNKTSVWISRLHDLKSGG